MISFSSLEAKYCALAKTTKEIIKLINLLKNMLTNFPRPIDLFYDNKVTIHIASNVAFHECMTHLKVGCHYVRQNNMMNFETNL